MAWLRLTLKDGTKTLHNSDNINSIIPLPNETYICHTGGGENDFTSVKESLEEIEAMLNKNEQPSMNRDIYKTIIEAVKKDIAKDIGRDYIGQHEPFQSPDSSFNKRGI